MDPNPTFPTTSRTESIQKYIEKIMYVYTITKNVFTIRSRKLETFAFHFDSKHLSCAPRLFMSAFFSID